MIGPLAVGAATLPGAGKPGNEDSFFVCTSLQGRPGCAAFAVADGVGGLAAGDVASQQALDAFVRSLQRARRGSQAELLRAAFVRAHSLVWSLSLRRSVRMATTLVAGLLCGSRAWIANVGDSRAYYISPRRIRQLTRDHSLVAERVRDGLVSEADAKAVPFRHVITRCLGSGARAPGVDLFGPVSLALGDRLLLCSDGLHDLVSDAEIADVVRRHPPQAAAEVLVSRSRVLGNRDDVSIVIVGRQDG